MNIAQYNILAGTMKQRFLILLCLLTLLPISSFAVGTEGREFWVALTIGRAPEDEGKGFAPKLCVSSKTRSGVVTVSNPQTNFTRSYPIPTGTGWLEITDIPTSEWYPFPANTGSQQSASGKTYKTGLKVTCSEDMSVFAALRYTNAFDASNILPITALQYEYIIQDYPPYANNSPSFSNFCILATENGTKVEITPSKKTYDGKTAGTTFTITLNAGDVYYVVSEEGSESNAAAVSLSGSFVKSDKPVAVFSGNICTRIPASKAARDINYEQNMPIDYWGKEFVVTRSLEKDANRIRITAQEDDTDVFINGRKFMTLNARQTHEIEISNALNISGFNLDSKDCFVQDAIFIQTSCPCAVYSYDTGRNYKSNNSEVQGTYGDPSMTWMSPLDQNINEITFGVMNTDMTTRHFVNIVTTTDNISSIELREVAGGQYSGNMLSAADFSPVPTLPSYSYARKALSVNKNTTYNLKGQKGFVAHVYGNGDDESYAYSVGSAAVKRAVNINGTNFTDGYRTDKPFCINSELEFDAQVGSDIIDKVDWDFGDGITQFNGQVQTTHTYDSPGWYDVTATIYAHKDCPETQYPAEKIQFSFRIQRPDTIHSRSHVCEGEPWEYDGKVYDKDTEVEITFDCDSVVLYQLHVGHHSPITDETVTGRDSALVNGKWYYENTSISNTYTNADGCDSVVNTTIRILACLNMSVENPEYECTTPALTELQIPYSIRKGEFTNAWFNYNNNRIELTFNDNYFTLPISNIAPGHYNGEIQAEDPLCEQIVSIPVIVDILYSQNVFAYKYGNVLAMYTPEYNGGYSFTSYQWYLNGQPIEGANQSIYHTEEAFAPGSEYSVRLTTADGGTQMSCPFVIPGQTAPTDSDTATVAKKIIRNNRLYISIDGKEYDIYGQPTN